jgi:hypothetical protein
VSPQRRFEKLEKSRPAGQEGRGPAPGVSDRFGSTGQGAPSAAAEAPSRTLGRPERFEPAPASGAALRLRELDEGQPFVRCARCRADGHASAVVCSHCGADLTTREQRAYNEGVWRRQQAERAEQQEQVARLEAARAQAEREAAEARRQLMEQVRRRPQPSWSRGDSYDAVRAGARRFGTVLGDWLRRTFPRRGQRVAFIVAAVPLALLVVFALVRLVQAFPNATLRIFGVLLVVGWAMEWYDRLRRWRE